MTEEKHETMAMSGEEHLKRKCEAEKKRRQRIAEDLDLVRQQNVKRRQRYHKKMNNQTAKVKKATRKKWREDKRKYSNKVLDNENSTSVSTRAESLRRTLKKTTENKRFQQYYQTKNLECENSMLRKRMEKSKKRYYQQTMKRNDSVMSPESKLNYKLKVNKFDSDSSKIKCQLLVADAVTSDIKELLSKIRSTKLKMLISQNIIFKYVREYHLLNIAKPYRPFKSFRSTVEEKRRVTGPKRKKLKLIKDYVHAFQEDDAISTLSPGKGQQVVRNKVKKQKRYLTNSLKYLF